MQRNLVVRGKTYVGCPFIQKKDSCNLCPKICRPKTSLHVLTDKLTPILQFVWRNLCTFIYLLKCEKYISRVP